MPGEVTNRRVSSPVRGEVGVGGLVCRGEGIWLSDARTAWPLESNVSAGDTVWGAVCRDRSRGGWEEKEAERMQARCRGGFRGSEADKGRGNQKEGQEQIAGRGGKKWGGAGGLLG